VSTDYGPSNGHESKKTNGDEAGTVIVNDLNPGAPKVTESNWIVAGSDLLAASDGVHGQELWKTDGTEGGTVMVADLNPGAASATPFGLVATDDGTVYFGANDGAHGMELWKLPQVVEPPAAVVARHVFYNRSSFDSNDAAANAADDNAIAADKNALLAGQDRLPGFDNVTSYDKGINGVMIDIANLPVIDALLDVDDFEFRPAGSRPVSVTVRPGAGEDGSDRVTLIWRDYNPLEAPPLPQAVGNGWLTVTVKANYHTGLAAPDVFSFGNLIGETGDGGGAAGWRVSALDLSAVKRSLNAAAPITSVTDFNRDGRTNALDLSIVKRNLNHGLALFPGPVPVPAPASVVLPTSAPWPERGSTTGWVSGLLGSGGKGAGGMDALRIVKSGAGCSFERGGRKWAKVPANSAARGRLSQVFARF